MSDASTVAKNTLVLFAGELIAHALGFVITIVLARYLGAAGFGIYSYVFAFASIVLIFSDIGTSTLMVRDASRKRILLKKYASNIIIIKLILSILLILAVFTITQFTNRTSSVSKEIYFAILAMILLEFSFFFRKYFNIIQELEYEAYIKVCEKVMTLTLILIAVFYKLNLFFIILLFVIAYGGTFVISAYYAFRRVGALNFKFVNFIFWRYLFKNSWQFWLATVFTVIYFKIDTVMLSFMTNYAAVGWYNAAYKLIDGLNFVPTLFIVAIFPAMSFLYFKDQKRLKKIFGKYVSYLFILAIPIGIGVTLLSDRIILSFFGYQYSNAALALQILIWAEVFVFVNYFMGFLLNAIDKQRLFTLTTLVGLICNVFLNLLLIPRYGIYGAAFATLFTEILNFIQLYSYSSEYGYSFSIIQTISKPIMASIVMALVIYATLSLHVLAIISLASAAYIIMLLLLRAIGKEEFNLFLSAIKKLRGIK